MQIIQRFQRGSGPQTQDGKRERKVTKKNEYAEIITQRIQEKTLIGSVVNRGEMEKSETKSGKEMTVKRKLMRRLHRKWPTQTPCTSFLTRMALKTVELIPSATSNSPFSLGRVKLLSRPEPNILKIHGRFFLMTANNGWTDKWPSVCTAMLCVR